MFNRGSIALISLTFLVLFLVQPFLTLLMVLLVGWIYCPKRYWVPSILVILGSAYIGLINTTKLPDSDLGVYLQWYESANGLGYFEFLGLFSREPIFYTWMYLISSLTNGDKNIFIFLTSWLSYFIFAYSILLVCRHANIAPRSTAMLIVIFLFFPLLFSISAHLMRQFLAAALITYFFARRIAEQKNSWWVIATAIFVHYSSILFVPLALLGLSRRLPPILSFVLSSVVLVFIYVMAKAGSGFLSDIPVFGLVFLRIAADEVPDVRGLTFNALIFVIIVSTVAATNLWERYDRFRAVLAGYFDRNLNIAVLSVGVIVVVSSLSSNTAEIAMRLYFYLYCLVGLVVPIFLINKKHTLLATAFIALLVVMYFYLALEIGVWRYAPIIDVLLLPAPLIWGAS